MILGCDRILSLFSFGNHIKPRISNTRDILVPVSKHGNVVRYFIPKETQTYVLSFILDEVINPTSPLNILASHSELTT